MKDLESYDAIMSLILRKVNCGHAAATKLAVDVVCASERSSEPIQREDQIRTRNCVGLARTRCGSAITQSSIEDAQLSRATTTFSQHDADERAVHVVPDLCRLDGWRQKLFLEEFSSHLRCLPTRGVHPRA